MPDPVPKAGTGLGSSFTTPRSARPPRHERNRIRPTTRGQPRGPTNTPDRGRKWTRRVRDGSGISLHGATPAWCDTRSRASSEDPENPLAITQREDLTRRRAPRSGYPGRPTRRNSTAPGIPDSVALWAASTCSTGPPSKSPGPSPSPPAGEGDSHRDSAARRCAGDRGTRRTDPAT